VSSIFSTIERFVNVLFKNIQKYPNHIQKIFKNNPKRKPKSEKLTEISGGSVGDCTPD